MRCDEAHRLLEESVDGRLLPLDRAALGEHLELCPSCPVELARLRSIVDALDALPEDPVPEDFAARVMAELPEMLPARHGVGHVARWGAAAAASLVVFVLGLAVLPSLAGPSVASGTLKPLSASLRLGGSLLASGATAALDAAAASLVTAGLGPKLLFALAFVACNAALAVAVHRYRELHVPAPATRALGHG